MTGAASTWSGRTHAQLAELARELLMAGHLIDRSGMPQLIARFGRETMTEVAIAEWMSASPVYSRRMQQLLGFEGDGVTTIFKGMQLDIGAPPEFLDFRYTVHDEHHGEFHLAHCGALADVEPMGEEFVHAMCHTIEDPTFDATAAATNPRAQVRPLHRPPRVPADRQPHCAWTVTIEPDAEPLPFPPLAEALGRSPGATLPLAPADTTLSAEDGWNDYHADLDPDLVMERFSSATLGRLCDEFALQGQLLTRAFLVQVADRCQPAEARAIGVQQAAGIAGLTTKRLAAALDVGADLDGLCSVLSVHPLLLPRAYTAARIEASDDGIELSLGAGPALVEDDGLSWPALLAGPDGDEILVAAVTCLVPTARVRRLAPLPGGGTAWTITDDPGTDPAPQPDAVTLTEFSTGATFAFTRRG